MCHDDIEFGPTRWIEKVGSDPEVIQIGASTDYIEHGRQISQRSYNNTYPSTDGSKENDHAGEDLLNDWVNEGKTQEGKSPRSQLESRCKDTQVTCLSEPK